jgi:hypothetical protein
MNIQKGNIIKIGKDKYDVLNVMEAIDKYDTEKNEFVGEHTAIELHKIGDSSLHPTHLLKVYHNNNKEAILLRIEQDKPPKWLKKPRQRGMMFSYHNKKTIFIADLQIEPAK